MTTATKKPTVAAFERYIRAECLLLVADLLAARLFAEAERARVDAYTMPIFAEYTFRPNPSFAEKGLPITITKPDDLYLCDMESPEYSEYNERILDANVAHGWMGNREFCPALIARSAVTEAEWALLDSLGRFMGFDGRKVYGEKREKALALAIDACANLR